MRAQEFHSRAFFASIALILGGCGARIPDGKNAISAVELRGVEAPEDIAPRLATKPTRTLAGMEGFYDYETLDEPALQKDLLRIERELRRRGYYSAKVSAARVIHEGEKHVRVEIQVEQGEPVIIRKLVTTGLAKLPFEAAEAASQQNKLRIGKRFDEDEFEAAKQEIANTLSNHGYAHARVKGTARVDLAANSAEVRITAEPGVSVTIGAIEFEGLKELEESPVRRIFGKARAALFQLGVFSRVEVTADLSDANQTVVPLKVKLKESTFKDITLGAGVRLDLLRLAAVGQGSWTHRNFFGGLRKFTIATRPGLTFFPTSIDNLRAPTRTLPENFATVRLEQPGLFEARTRAFIEGGYNISPLLYPLPEESDPREERIIGYNEVTSAIGAERAFFSGALTTSLAFHAQTNVPFYYQGDERGVNGLEPVTVTYPELKTALDFRDDPIQPTQGALLTNSLQVAIPFQKDQVFDVRIEPEVRGFLPLDQDRRIILAARVGTGLVFPQNYGCTLTSDSPDECSDVVSSEEDPHQEADVIRDQHKLLFRAFYSGGPGSNRGYPYRRIGPQGPIGFLLPEDVTCEDTGGALPSACIRPLGGFTMWEASLELRYRAFENWSFVTFIDASDVTSGVMSYSLAKPHISVGPGMRYLSPVGPIRVDVGWRVPGLQRLSDDDNQPKPDVADVEPYASHTWAQGFALHILIGEDF